MLLVPKREQRQEPVYRAFPLGEIEKAWRRALGFYQWRNQNAVKGDLYAPKDYGIEQKRTTLSLSVTEITKQGKGIVGKADSCIVDTYIIITLGIRL